MEQYVAHRLLIAVLLSAALHLSLIFGVAVRRPSAAPSSEPIFARIEAATPQLAPQILREAAKPFERRPRLAKIATTDALDRRRVVDSPPSRHTDPQARAEDSAPQATPQALPAVELPLLADPTWYTAKQLDVFPVALQAVKPAYPQRAAAENLVGEVTLLLLIDDTGRVQDGSVIDAQPAGHFEEAALEAFRAARFVPGQRDGLRVRSRILVKVSFMPSQAEPSP